MPQSQKQRQQRRQQWRQYVFLHHAPNTSMHQCGARFSDENGRVSECQKTSMEDSSTTLLLEVLEKNFPPNVQKLLSDSAVKEEAQQYLWTLFNSQDSVLTSESTNENDNLVNEIAELEAAQRKIEDQLKSAVSKLSSNIIHSRFELNEVMEIFNKNFKVKLDEMKKNLEDQVQSSAKDTDNDDVFNSDYKKYEDVRKKSGQEEGSLVDNIDSIIDILELPTLANACVKSGYYQETLEISAYTKRLSLRYPNNEIVRQVEIGINKEIQEMTSGLLKLLKTDLKQSNLVKILSYLYKIPPFNEDAILKRIFLQSRFQFIVGELDLLVPLKEHSVDKFLKRVIELIREHCFSSIITYQSMFNDETKKARWDIDDFFEKDVLDDNIDDEKHQIDAISEDEILVSGFINSVISEFLAILTQNFNAIEEHKDSLILQTIYCSQSLGRIGGEFGSMILNKLSELGITEEDWFRIFEKQRALIKDLNR